MRGWNVVLAGTLVIANLSCAAGTGATKPPSAAPTPGATAPRVGTVAPPSVPSGTPTAPGSTTTGTPPGTNVVASAPPGGPPRRVPLTPEQRAARRDSLSMQRTAVLADLMTKIAGYETKRADDEFTNIQLMKDTTAVQLLKTMDYYGKSLSVGCQFCHVAGGKWDDDSKEAKKTTRVMIELVNMINNNGLSKLPAGRSGNTPKISCMTCHRGNTQPGTAMLP